MKKIFLTLALLIGLSGTASAAMFQGDENLVIKNPVEDDLYAGGSLLQVNTEIGGDLFAAGGKLTLDGTIQQDVMAAGGDVLLNGSIQDDARVAGGDVHVNATIEGDLIVMGGNVYIESETWVKGDVILLTGNTYFNGKVDGNITGYAGQLTLNGIVGKSIHLKGVDSLTFGEGATVGEDLNYKSREEVEIPSNTVGGNVNFEKQITPQTENALPAIFAAFSIYKLLSLLLSGLLLIWIFRYFGLDVIQRIQKEAGKSFGIGLLGVIVTPIASFLALITMIGAPIAMILTASWLILLYLGKLGAAMFIGNALIKVDAKSSGGRIFGSFALGVLLVILIGLIPYIGLAASFVLTAMGLGGILMSCFGQFKVLRDKKLI